MSGGGDGSFDPCECYNFNHLASMRRLINMIRDSQSACNDRECLINPTSQMNASSMSSSSGDFQLMFIFTAWVLLMSFMYLFWPNSRRVTANKKSDDLHFDSPNHDSDNNQPPAPGVH